MNGIIDFANKFFKPILDMGAPIIMLIVLLYWLSYLE